MKVKGKRILKNGTIAGYVYNSKTKKWNWRFIGRQTGGDRTLKKSEETLINTQLLSNKINSQLLSNKMSRNMKNIRNTKLNYRPPYQKERNALLNYLDDKVRRTAFFRPKRKKKFRNISNRIRNSVENNEVSVVNGVNGIKKVNVLKKAHENIGLILDKGTRNNKQLFENLTKKVHKYRTQRKQKKINNKKNLKIILNKVQRGQNI